MTMGEDADPAEFRTFMPLRYRAVLAAVGIAAVSTLLATGQWPLVFVAVLVAAIFVAAITMTVRIRLDEACLSVRVAGLFSTTIPYCEISAVSAGPATGFLQGMGLRVLPGGGIGYLVGGRSVRIQCSRSTVLVSCADPQEFVTRVVTRIPR